MGRALAVAAVALVLPASASARPLFGFNDLREVWRAVGAQTLELGANTARFPVGWNTPPAEVAQDVARLRSWGLRPLIALWGCDTPIDLDAYAEQVRAYTAAYPDAIIQLWNEPNHEAFGNYSPREAAQLVRVGARAARSVRPRGPILGPGLAPQFEAGGTRLAPGYRAYLRGLYRRIPERLRIGVGLHVFPYAQEPMDVLRRFYRLASRFGRVWVTEVGFFGNTYRDRQAQISARGYRFLSRAGARAIIFHRLLPVDAQRRTGSCKAAPAGYGAPVSDWEAAASMSVLDDPPLAAALARARQRDGRRR